MNKLSQYSRKHLCVAVLLVIGCILLLMGFPHREMTSTRSIRRVGVGAPLPATGYWTRVLGWKTKLVCENYADPVELDITLLSANGAQQPLMLEVKNRAVLDLKRFTAPGTHGRFRVRAYSGDGKDLSMQCYSVISKRSRGKKTKSLRIPLGVGRAKRPVVTLFNSSYPEVKSLPPIKNRLVVFNPGEEVIEASFEVMRSGRLHRKTIKNLKPGVAKSFKLNGCGVVRVFASGIFLAVVDRESARGTALLPARQAFSFSNDITVPKLKGFDFWLELGNAPRTPEQEAEQVELKVEWWNTDATAPFFEEKLSVNPLENRIYTPDFAGTGLARPDFMRVIALSPQSAPIVADGLAGIRRTTKSAGQQARIFRAKQQRRAAIADEESARMLYELVQRVRVRSSGSEYSDVLPLPSTYNRGLVRSSDRREEEPGSEEEETCPCTNVKTTCVSTEELANTCGPAAFACMTKQDTPQCEILLSQSQCTILNLTPSTEPIENLGYEHCETYLDGQGPPAWDINQAEACCARRHELEHAKDGTCIDPIPACNEEETTADSADCASSVAETFCDSYPAEPMLCMGMCLVTVNSAATESDTECVCKEESAGEDYQSVAETCTEECSDETTEADLPPGCPDTYTGPSMQGGQETIEMTWDEVAETLCENRYPFAFKSPIPDMTLPPAPPPAPPPPPRPFPSHAPTPDDTSTPAPTPGYDSTPDGTL